MFKVVLPFCLLNLGALQASEKAMRPEEAVALLQKPLAEGSLASEDQYDAYRELVSQGPDGWESLFGVLCRTDRQGDAARKIDSLWESGGIPGDLLQRFDAAERAEIARRASDETWALPYAGAYVRTEHRSRGESVQECLDRHFSALGKCKDSPEDALIQVAFLRVRLVGKDDFPGHRFPWAEKAEVKIVALQGLLEWWKEHRDEFGER